MNSSYYEEEQVFNIYEVLELMKNGLIFYSFDNKGRKVIYVKKKDKIIIQCNSYKISVDLNEFLSLYKNEKFFIFEKDKEDFVDEEKDKEYYSWEHK